MDGGLHLAPTSSSISTGMATLLSHASLCLDTEMNTDIAGIIRECLVNSDCELLPLFLEKLPHLPFPASFLSIIPQLSFSYESLDHIFPLIFDSLSNVQQDHPDLRLQLLQTLCSIPILPSHRFQLQASLNEAIDTIEEEDFHKLIKLLITASSSLDITSKLSALLISLASLNESNLLPTVHVLLELLPCSSIFSASLIDELIKLNNISRQDVPFSYFLLTLICFGTPLTSRNASNIFRYWLSNQTFPFDHLQHLQQLYQNDAAWGSLNPRIWKLCLFLISEGKLSFLSPSFDLTSSSPNLYSTYCLKQLNSIVTNLYRHDVHMQESIQNYLAYHSFEADSDFLNKSCSVSPDSEDSWSASLPPLGESQMEFYSKAASLKRSEKLTFHTADVCSFLLLRMQEEEGDFSMNRNSIGRNSVNFGGLLYQTLQMRLVPDHDHLLRLPPPVILDRIITCIVTSAIEASDLESALLINIQKLLGSSQSAHPSQSAVLSSLFSSQDNFSTLSLPPKSSLLPLDDAPASSYTLLNIGVRLAASMVLKHTGLSAQDREALLQWLMGRCSQPPFDSSTVLAVEALGSLIHHPSLDTRMPQSAINTIVTFFKSLKCVSEEVNMSQPSFSSSSLPCAYSLLDICPVLISTSFSSSTHLRISTSHLAESVAEALQNITQSHAQYSFISEIMSLLSVTIRSLHSTMAAHSICLACPLCPLDRLFCFPPSSFNYASLLKSIYENIYIATILAAQFTSIQNHLLSHPENKINSEEVQQRASQHTLVALHYIEFCYVQIAALLSNMAKSKKLKSSSASSAQQAEENYRTSANILSLALNRLRSQLPLRFLLNAFLSISNCVEDTSHLTTDAGLSVLSTLACNFLARSSTACSLVCDQISEILLARLVKSLHSVMLVIERRRKERKHDPEEKFSQSDAVFLQPELSLGKPLTDSGLTICCQLCYLIISRCAQVSKTESFSALPISLASGLFDRLEVQVRTTSDSSLAMAGFQTLLLLSKGTSLMPRLPALSLHLSTLVFHSRVDTACRLSGSLSDSVSQALHGLLYNSSLSAPFVSLAASTSERAPHNLARTVFRYIENNGAGLGDESHLVSAYFYLAWWLLEKGDNGERMNGVTLLLCDVLSLFQAAITSLNRADNPSLTADSLQDLRSPEEKPSQSVISLTPIGAPQVKVIGDAIDGAHTPRESSKKIKRIFAEDDDEDAECMSSRKRNAAKLKADFLLRTSRVLPAQMNHQEECGDEYSTSFPTLSEDSAVFYFVLAFSLLPASFLDCCPHKSYTYSPLHHLHSGPYESIIRALQTCAWTLNQLTALIQSEETISFLLDSSLASMKGCLALIEAIEEVVSKCSMWRSEQPMLKPSISMEEGSDPGSLHFFGVLIAWVIETLQQMKTFLNRFKQYFIDDHSFEVKKTLLKVLQSANLQCSKRIKGIRDAFGDIEGAVTSEIRDFVRNTNLLSSSSCLRKSNTAFKSQIAQELMPESTTKMNSSFSSAPVTSLSTCEGSIFFSVASSKSTAEALSPTGWGIYTSLSS